MNDIQLVFIDPDNQKIKIQKRHKIDNINWYDNYDVDMSELIDELKQQSTMFGRVDDDVEYFVLDNSINIDSLIKQFTE